MPPKREPGIPECFALNRSRFRVRVRQVPATPRNDSVGHPNIFSYLPIDNIPIRFIFRYVLPHREGRSRSSRSRGGMRWTPEMRRHAVWGGRLSSGRTDLRQHCHWQETADLRMERILDSVTDDQVKTRSAYSLEAPFPSPWDFNSRSERSSRQSASNRKNTAGGTLGNRSAPPKVLMHSRLRKTAFASGPRVQRAPGVPHALSQGGGNASDDGAPAPQKMGAMTHV
jgi:hypothetical protein